MASADAGTAEELAAPPAAASAEQAPGEEEEEEEELEEEEIEGEQKPEKSAYAEVLENGAGQAGSAQASSLGALGMASPKHELQHRWCLWVHQRPGSQKGQGQAWSESQKMVHEFGTAEDFWCMFQHSYPPSKLENVDYSLFKQGVTPAWEDRAFRQGGRWVIKLEKVKAQSLDDLWLSLSLALIGEVFLEHGGEHVCGAIVSVRSRASKIALWLSGDKDAQGALSQKKVMAVGKEYRNALASTPGLQDLASKEITFEDFMKQQVTLTLGGSLRPKQTVEATAGLFQ